MADKGLDPQIAPLAETRFTHQGSTSRLAAGIEPGNSQALISAL